MNTFRVPCSLNHRSTRLGCVTLASLQEFLFKLSGKFVSQHQLSNTLYVYSEPSNCPRIIFIFASNLIMHKLLIIFFTENYRQLWMCWTNTASQHIMIFIVIINVKRLFCFLSLEWFSFFHWSVYFDKQ